MVITQPGISTGLSSDKSKKYWERILKRDLLRFRPVSHGNKSEVSN